LESRKDSRIGAYFVNKLNYYVAVDQHFAIPGLLYTSDYNT